MKQQHDAPVAEQKQTNDKATGNGYKNPDNIDNEIEPGIANVCKLYCSNKVKGKFSECAALQYIIHI